MLQQRTRPCCPVVKLRQGGVIDLLSGNSEASPMVSQVPRCLLQVPGDQPGEGVGGDSWNRIGKAKPLDWSSCGLEVGMAFWTRFIMPLWFEFFVFCVACMDSFFKGVFIPWDSLLLKLSMVLGFFQWSII